MIVIKPVILATVFLAAFISNARSAEFSEATVEALRQAMLDPARPAEDRTRDESRKPVKTLMFLRLTENMRVVELFPGQGWYTRLLAPVLAEHGKLYTALGTSQMEGLREKIPAFENLKPGVRLVPTDVYGVYNLQPVDLGVGDIDLIVTFRNLHNLTAAGRANLLAAVQQSLKPGGLFGVVDHTRRHMEPNTVENRRRLDPVVVIREATAAGLVFVDFSDLHRIPDDALHFDVGRKSVAGNSDRFTLLFQKPPKA
jgi:predicted methyltransferase